MTNGTQKFNATRVVIVMLNLNDTVYVETEVKV